MLLHVLQALHVLGAVLWVGGMFFVLFALRPALPQLEPAAERPKLMRRVAGLLYVGDRESGAARKRALDRLGLDG